MWIFAGMSVPSVEAEGAEVWEEREKLQQQHRDNKG